MQKMKIQFEDVGESGCGHWDRVCCMHTYGPSVQSLGSIDCEYTCSGEVLCAVLGCRNKAAYYGQFCEFEHRKGEFHDNDIVLAQHAPNIDTETEGAFSIKKIEKRGDEIILRPVNAAHDPVTLPAAALGGDYKIVGTLRGKI